jgi:hypothetical protein
MDLDRALYDTEDFLERQLGSGASRQLAKRKLQRGVREAGRRFRRAGLIFLLLLFALIIADVAGASVGFFTWVFALAGMAMAALFSMLWPTRASRRSTVPAGAAESLDQLAGAREEWLLERCRELPRPALPAVDSILYNLREMQPCLAHVTPNSRLHGETQRLVGEHLPRLVESYLAIPYEARAPGSQNDLRIAESLDLVAQELHRLCVDVTRERSDGFEVNRRFIESRYGDER